MEVIGLIFGAIGIALVFYTAVRIAYAVGKAGGRRELEQEIAERPAQESSAPAPEKIVVVPGRVVISPQDLPRPVRPPRAKAARRATTGGKRVLLAGRIVRRMWR